MPKAKQLTAWVENRPGMLGEVGSALGAKKVNIVAFMATVADSHGTIRMVVDKPAAEVVNPFETLPTKIH